MTKTTQKSIVNPKKIDIHCHTTNRPLPNTLYGNARLDTIKENMENHNIEETIVLASYFPHKGSGISNFRMLNWIQNENNINMFASLDFNHFFWQGMSELEEIADNQKVKGIKIYTCYQEIDLKGDKLAKILNLAEEKHLPIMFHTGLSYTAKRNYGKDTITEKVSASDLAFIGDNYNIDVVLSHMSKPYFDETIDVLQKYPQFKTDISGLIDSKYDQNEIEQTIDAITKVAEHAGTNQILFGTDFPVQSYEDSIMFVEKGLKDFSQKERENVYYNNAKKLLTKA